jgi:uncharacterized membrane protein YphA (DoxX/SURF4 family)
VTEHATQTAAAPPAGGRWAAIQPWLSLVVRLAMAAILVFAAIPKLQDIDQSVRAVRAYRLLPEAVVPFVGTALPFLELVLAALLLVGVFTRLAAFIWLGMMAAFLVGVIWVWAKGYSIDCGCFGGGGDVEEGTTNYPLHLMERLGFIAMGAFLAAFPRSALSVDAWMRGDTASGRPRLEDATDTQETDS